MKRICKWKRNSVLYATGTVYYIDTIDGSDTNNGLSANTPFKTEEHAESLLVEGDVLIPTISDVGPYPSTGKSNFKSYRLFNTIRNSNPITASISASRTSGVAPLAVVFDATSTTGLTDNAFFADNATYMDATFHWNFDSTGADNDAKYTTGSGFVAGHVYENPGSYVVHLDVYDANHIIGSSDITITVSAFSGSTYYVAANGNDANNGSITNPFLTVSHALTGPHVQNNTRILFRNGDTFNTAYVNIDSAATGVIVSNYNDPNNPSDDLPLIYSTEADASYSAIDLDSSDWRIMNIALRSGGATYNTGVRYPSGLDFGGYSQFNLKYRCVEYSLGQMPMKMAGRYNIIAECDFSAFGLGAMSSDDWGYNENNAIIGNYIHDKGVTFAGHVFRLQSGYKLYIAHNTSTRIANIAYDAWTTRGHSNNIIYYKNRIEGWVTYAAPEVVDTYDQRVHHIMYDSNLLIGPFYDTGGIGDSTSAFRIRAKDMVFRNNIIYNYGSAFLIEDDSVVGASTRIRAYNNTYIGNVSDGAFRMFMIEAACTDLDFKNNLMIDIGGSNVAYRYFIYFTEGSTLNGESDYNQFYGSSWGSIYIFNGDSLAAWQTTTENDLHSAISNPNLIDIDIDSASFGQISTVITGSAIKYNALDYYGNRRGSINSIGAHQV